MKTRTMLSVVGLAIGAMLALVLLLASGGTTGEYHSGGTLLCFDCHTIHFSMQHGFAGGAVGSTPTPGGDWIGSTGPNQFLLKMPANDLCKACHDGQTYAPDVWGDHPQNAGSYLEGREAGGLPTAATPYENWKGHELDSTTRPPGYNPGSVGLADWYPVGSKLECINCHAQHGPAYAYRNLGSYAIGGTAANFRPTYSITSSSATAISNNADVWVNLGSYTAGSGNAATFGPYYSRANINFIRNDATLGSIKTSNRMGSFCAACHASFHGGPGDTNIGASPGALDGFIRHPTAQTTLGAAGAQGYGGHSSLSRYVGASKKAKVGTRDFTAYTDATPLCVSCHKGHGNQNPFGLIFLARSATTVNDEGGYASGQTTDTPTGLRNLCGQCHGQGN